MPNLDNSLFRFIWRNSRGQQLIVLAVIVLSLPFYFASFDVPKRIINEALQGRAFEGGKTTTRFMEITLPLPESLGGATPIFGGFEVTQLGLLWGLSLLFLTLVIINGGFKYYVNVMKGILGERLLRRMRYVLVDLYMRFKPEDIRGVKPAEAASIIKDEVDPIGTFSGDAFILPAFLSMQALTALVFILVQSVWLGLVAFAVVLIQAIVIPILRREQLRLSRLRQIESRKLAGQVGEIVETAPAIQVMGSGAYTRGEVGARLATLFDIRVKLFRRKFSVKYLNNLLAQVTPFFFYAIGGYLALTGKMDIGQLVAAIAAYKELPPPIKDLIDWDQMRADVTVRYQQILAQFPPAVLPEADDGDTPAMPDETAPLVIAGLKALDKRGAPILDTLTLTLERPAHIAVVGPVGSGRDALVRILGRQILDFSGRVTIGDVSWASAHHCAACRAMAYAGPEPFVTSGSIRDNLLASLRRPPPPGAEDATPLSRHLRREAELSGTPADVPDDSWIDYAAAGLADAADLDRRIVAVLEVSGLADDVTRMGLQSRIDPEAESEFVSRIPAAREMILKNLAAKDLTHLVDPLDPDRYNRNASIAENLLFGKPIGERLAEGRFASDLYLRSILEAESLLHPLMEIGVAMAETAIEIFADLAPGDPLFARFSFISAEDMPEYQRLIEQARSRGSVGKLAREGQARLIELAFQYVEPRFRLQLLTPQLQRRILRARESFRRHLPLSYAEDIEFYHPDRYMTSGTVQDNLLFGRIAIDAPDAAARVRDAAAEALKELGIDREINRIGLSHEVGPSGRLLQPQQRAGLALARTLLPRSAIVVIDGAFGAFSPAEGRRLLESVRKDLAGRTLVVSLPDAEQAQSFDSVLVFDGPRLAESRLASPQIAEPDASVNLPPLKRRARRRELSKEGEHAGE